MADAVAAPATPVATWLQRRLGRATSSGEHIRVIDGLRFVALAMVVFLHVATAIWSRDPVWVETAGVTMDWVTPSQFGLQIFFVLSACLLALPFARRAKGGPPVSLRRYYMRRLTRLEPPYLLALTAFLLLHPLLGHGSFDELAPHYVSGLFYTHWLTHGAPNPILEVAWSLEVEVQFYLLMPLLATVFRIRDKGTRRKMLIAGVVATTGLAHALTIGHHGEGVHDLPLAFLTLPGHLNMFLLGMLMADVLVHDWNGRKTTAWGDVAFAAGMTGLYLTEPAFGPSRTLLMPVSCILVVGGALRGRFFRPVLEKPAIFLIGGMCYSIYLLHFGIVRFAADGITWGIAPASPLLDFVVSSLVLATACLLISVAYFVWIERPCMFPDWPGRARTQLGRVIEHVRLSLTIPSVRWLGQRPPWGWKPATNRVPKQGHDQSFRA